MLKELFSCVHHFFSLDKFSFEATVKKD